MTRPGADCCDATPGGAVFPEGKAWLDGAGFDQSFVLRSSETRVHVQPSHGGTPGQDRQSLTSKVRHHKMADLEQTQVFSLKSSRQLKTRSVVPS